MSVPPEEWIEWVPGDYTEFLNQPSISYEDDAEVADGCDPPADQDSLGDEG